MKTSDHFKTHPLQPYPHTLTPPEHSRCSRSWEEALAQQGNLSVGQCVLQSLSEEDVGAWGGQRGRMDMQQLLSNITRLERLLSLNRHQRKIETSRHEQDIKQLARELSLREAETMLARQQAEAAQQRAGQLMDECESALRGKEQAELALLSEKKANEQLQISYDALAAQVAVMCQESQTIQSLRDQLSLSIKQRQQAQRETAALQQKEKMQLMQLEQCEQRLWQEQQECYQLQVKLAELQEEIRSKDQVINKYQHKLTELQEKINGIELSVGEQEEQEHEQQQQEEQEYIHRVAYTAHTHTHSTSQQCMRIQEGLHLRRIIQEELQESLASLDDHMRRSEQGKREEIVTATTLADHKELQLLQLLTQNLEREHSQLKQLFRQQQQSLTDKHLQLQQVEKSLAQMRYEFLLQLSRVTALMNQQILQNRSLREENILLQSALNAKTQQPAQAKERPEQRTVDHSVCLPTMVIGSFEREACQRSRCRQLEHDNQMLLQYNREREELYELLLGSRMDPSSLIRQKLQHSLKYILDHRQQYGSLLKHYGLSAPEEPPLPQAITSHIINQFGGNQGRENGSQIHQLEVLHSQPEEELLMLQSTAKQPTPNEPTVSSLQNALSSLSQLIRQRQKIGSLEHIPQGYDRERQRKDIVGRIKKLKVAAMGQGKSKSLLSTFIELQRAIDQLCYT